MKISRKVSLLIILLTTALSFQAQAERYIVKYKNPSSFKSMAHQLKKQNDLFNKLGTGPLRQGVQFMNARAQITDAFENLEMVVVDAEVSEAELEQLAQNPAIDYIEKEIIIPAPKPFSTEPPLFAEQNYSTFANDEDKPVKGIPYGIVAVRAPEAWALSATGRDIKVMVLDTGVDKNHPAIRSNFIAGKNFVDDGMATPYDYFDYIGHGTHVAGTILADGVTTGLVGVAPHSKLLMGRVCTYYGCPSSSILAGINWAIEQKVQVLNMSLGGPFPSPGGKEAYLRADRAGVMVVSATGNDGVERVSYPAAYDTVLAVGSVDSKSERRAGFSNWGPQLDVVAPGVNIYSSMPQGLSSHSEVFVDIGSGPTQVKSIAIGGSGFVSKNLEGEMVYAGLGRVEDFQRVDVSGKVALIRRGAISFGDKTRNAVAAGAIAVVLFNTESGFLHGKLDTAFDIPVVMIEQRIGEFLVEKINEGLSIASAVGNLSHDYMALEGTSMASPHVAGAVALIRSVNPYLTPAEVRQLITQTARPVKDQSDNQVGKGLIDVAAAVEVAQRLLPASPLAQAN